MIRVIKQCVRGMQTLPGVGSHPGTPWVVLFPLGGSIAAGVEHGATGYILGAAVFLVLFGPLYLWGSYERAELSDQIVEKKENSHGV